MPNRLFVPCLLLVVWLASAQQNQPEPDACTVTNNTIESKFFKFQYSFPQGWSTVNDELRTAENRKRHEDQVKKELAKLPPDTADTKHTIQVFWTYDLLLATPQPFAPGDKAGVPKITIRAQERFQMLNEPGDQAKLVAMIPTAKALRKPEEIKLSGRRFVRSDFVYRDDSFEALFVTVSGKYLLNFDIRGSSEKEVNDLAQTMQTLKFL
jgi:hypothetical protein